MPDPQALASIAAVVEKLAGSDIEVPVNPMLLCRCGHLKASHGSGLSGSTACCLCHCQSYLGAGLVLQEHR